MKSLFIVTSAIHTSYGKYSTEERIIQTKKTLESISTYAKDSGIVLLDCGEKSIDKNLFNCEIIDYTKNLEIKTHLQNFLDTNTDLYPEIIVKSMLEILIMDDYLKVLQFNQYDRIFKISGRYNLNENFNHDLHLNSKNKVVLLRPNISLNLYKENNPPSIFLYSTRCWSFDSNLLDSIRNVYKNMKKNILSISKTKNQGDIEHLFYKHLNKKIVKHIDVMGLEGYWAPEGRLIKE